MGLGQQRPRPESDAGVQTNHCASVSRNLSWVPWNADEPEDKAGEPKDSDERMLSAWRPIDVEGVTRPRCQMGGGRNLHACAERASDVGLGRRHRRFSEHDGGDALDVFGVRVHVPKIRYGARGERLDRATVMRPDRGRRFDRLRKLVAHGRAGDGKGCARSQQNEGRAHESGKRQTEGSGRSG